MMEAKSQNLQLNKLCTVAKDYVVTSQAYMKRELNEYHVQSKNMISLSAEIKSVNQNIADPKSTMRLLQGKLRSKKLRADEELEGKINDQRELLKDMKEKHSTAVKNLQTKITDQKQLVNDVKKEKEKLV